MATDLELYQRLNTELVSLVDHFTNLVKGTREGLDADDARDASGQAGSRDRRIPGELLEVLVEKLLIGGHQCVHTVSLLKKGAMISDFDSLMGNVKSLSERLDKDTKSTEEELDKIKVGAQHLLAELEEHYYSSAHKGQLPTTEQDASSSTLAELCVQALQVTGG